MNKRRICALTLSAALAVNLCACTAPAGSASSASSAPAASEDGEASLTQTALQGQPIQMPGGAQSAEDTTLVPAVPTWEIADDLSNVLPSEYLSLDYFSEQAKQALSENGFLVTYAGRHEFYEIYETNRYSYVPSFITVDSLLHTYHLYYAYLLKTVEREELAGRLLELSRSMQSAAADQLEQLRGTDWEQAARRNLAFFSVGCALQDPDAVLPEEVADLVSEELALIREGSGIAPSPIMNLGEMEQQLKEDYTQYIPRSYYAEDDTLSGYFRAMMWYGRMTFLSANEDTARSAALLTQALSASDARQNWEDIYAVTSFFAGASDDPNCADYEALLSTAYGSVPGLEDLTGDAAAWSKALELLPTLRTGSVNSIPVYEKEDHEAATGGLRFMGQRFTLDGDIFQQLVYQEVKENDAGEYRMLPSVLDIPAALGSDTALEILTEQGAAEYEGYSENMTELRTAMEALPEETWSANLYNGWLNTLAPLAEAKGEGWPVFMQNEAWAAKDLNSFAGSWTELKHDTALYSKQVYAEMGGGPIDEADDRGYVEPQPAVFGRLAALCQNTLTGLDSFGMLRDSAREDLELMSELSTRLMEISEKELRNEACSEEDYELIRTYGGQLEHFWVNAMQEEAEAKDIFLSPMYLPAAIVTDVATDPNGFVLEEGTDVGTIYVLVEIDGQLRLTRGSVYNTYEFAQPLTERLTDQQWRLMLGIDTSVDENGMPIQETVDVPHPEWTSRFALEDTYDLEG